MGEMFHDAKTTTNNKQQQQKTDRKTSSEQSDESQKRTVIITSFRSILLAEYASGYMYYARFSKAIITT